MSDWVIQLVADDDRFDEPSHGTLEILPEGCDEQDAIGALEDYAHTIERLGFIPDTGMDWRNRSPACVVRRRGRRSFTLRVDCFEFETENGYSNGYGSLRAVER